MCGIGGLIHKKNTPLNEERVRSFRDSMLHRGPDSGGQFLHENIAFVHRRLSIIDISENGNQPFHSICGRYILVFNGEIFNYAELKQELCQKGIVFRTNSDTEVLLQILIHEGLEALHKLNGFWAFAFFDKSTKETIIVRDRAGVKPLFFCDSSEYFAFASEPKAFFAYGYQKQVAEEHLDELFIYRHVSGENTIFSGVKRLLPGHYMIVDWNGAITKKKRWYHLGSEIQNHPRIEQPYHWFEQTFLSSMQYRMIADVQVGTLLSGGLDSSAVLYSQNILGFKQISTWNISFADKVHNESDLASKLSGEYGYNFHSFEFNGNDLVSLTWEALHVFDEPFMHTQEPHLLGLSKLAKQDVSVLLSGEAADELLGGYVRYKVHDRLLRYRLLKLLRYVPSKYISDYRWSKMQRYLQTKNIEMEMLMNANGLFLKDIEEHHVHAMNLLPEYRVNMLEEAKSVYPNNRFRQLMYLEQFTHLCSLNDRNDRVTMGASIENREPFEDFRLMAGVMSLPDSFFTSKGKGKKLLLNSIGKHLPDYITKHRKIGLSIPWDDLILNTPYFREHFNTMLTSDLMKLYPYAQLDLKDSLVSFANGDRSDSFLIRQIFFHTLWFNHHFATA